MNLENEMLIADADDQSNAYMGHLKEREAADNEAWLDREFGAPALDTEATSHIQSGIDSRSEVDFLKTARDRDYGGPQGVASAVARNVADVPLSVGYGIMEGINEASRAIHEMGGGAELAERLRADIPESDDSPMAQGMRKAVDIYEAPHQFPNIFDAPDTMTGETVSKISQFLTGFLAGGKGLQAAGVGPATSTAGKFLESAAKGGIADFGFFDAQEEGLSNLIQEVPALANPVTEFLAHKEGDSQFEGRLKNTLEGLGLGTVTEGLAKAFGATVKAIKKGQAGKARLKEIEHEGNLKKEITEETPPALLESLGRLDQPVVMEAPKQSAAAAGDLTENVPAVRGGAEKTPDDHFYINFARIDTPDDVKDAMQFMADKYKDQLNAARRGEKMTFKQMELNADQEDAWRILSERRTGQPLNAEQSLAARNLWASSGQKLSETAKAVAAAPTEENMFAFMKMLNIHNSIQKEVIAARTETARALASWRITSGPRELQLRQMEEMLSATPGGVKEVMALAQDVAKLSDAGLVRELDKFVEKSPLAIARGMVQEFWIMSLLSGPKTHIVNMMSNTFVAMQQVFERGVAARIGRALGDDAGVQIGEGLALLHGQLSGTKDGLRLAGKYFKENQGGFWAGKVDIPPTPAISAENMGLSGDSMLGGAVDVIGNVIRTPGRALMAEDEFFKTVGYRSQLNALAFRQATREAEAGKIGKDQIRQRMAEILDNPPDTLKVAAVDHATYSTFQDAPGKFAKKWLEICREMPELRFITPFIKTPARIFNYAVAERSPMAPLFRQFREDVAAGGARRQLALARVSTGTTTMLVAADLAFGGHITGGGPPDTAERQTLARTGWQPYSIKLGDRYFSYARTDPLGMTFGIAADLAEIVNNMDHSNQEVDPEEAATFFVASIAGNVMSKSYMSGLSNMVEALGDPKRYSEGFFKRFAGSFVPALSNEAAKFNDPYMLEVNSMVDAMKARIPGLSKDLPARRDLWGRAISYRSGLGVLYDALSPIASRRENPEPVDQEMLRQEVYVASPGSKINFDGVNVDLSRFGDAYSRYTQLAGNETKHMAWRKGCMDLLNETVEGRGPLAPQYKMLSDGPEGGKAQFIKSTIVQYRELARKQLLKEYPELRAYLEELKAAKPGKYNF